MGIGEYTTPWSKELRIAEGEQLESVVLFALDQFCLIGYRLPLERGTRRSQYQGAAESKPRCTDRSSSTAQVSSPAPGNRMPPPPGTS